MCTHTRTHNLHTLVFCVFVPLAHMVDVCICDQPTPAPHPHYTLPPCHFTLLPHRLNSPHPTSASLSPHPPASGGPRGPQPRVNVWGHERSTHRWLTYLSGSRSTSWVGRIVSVCSSMTHAYICTYIRIYTHAHANAHTHAYTQWNFH